MEMWLGRAVVCGGVVVSLCAIKNVVVAVAKEDFGQCPTGTIDPRDGRSRAPPHCPLCVAGWCVVYWLFRFRQAIPVCWFVGLVWILYWMWVPVWGSRIASVVIVTVFGQVGA